MASTSTHAFEEVAPSASSSSRSMMPVKKLPYDVFINHRGPDVKHTLAAAIYNTLGVMGLRVFLDSEELELGDFLPREIEEAMRTASLHIALFSQNYAQSPWCLAELTFMLKTGVKIVPVFYQVQPDDVRYAKGVYAEAFSQHKKKGRYSTEKLQEWKNALNSVSYNVGHIVNNKDDEGRLLKNIVNCVLKVVKNVPFVVAKHPVGLDEAVLDFETRLQSVESHPTVQIVGIWGMGGSGKTTLAKQLYNNKCKTMEKSSFLFDVRDAASKSVLHTKQKKLIEDLGLHGVSIDNLEEGKGILASRLRSIRVLIVLDDVDTVDQLDALVPEKDSLGQGSLIVVTTRECDVLLNWGISFIYKMKALDSPHAKQLFCWHAFLQPSPVPQFEYWVEKFLDICKGLPLSLKVFGAQLYGKSRIDYWKSQLHKISRLLDKNIKEQLKVSYDALDDEEKHAFLDCACFFIGEEKSLAIAVWDGSGWSGLYNWEKLLNKCLVELDDYDWIRMHDHLKDLGREIANQKAPYRLWSPQQIVDVDNETQRICVRGIMGTTAGSTSEVEFPQCSEGGELILNTSRECCSLTPNLLALKIFQVRGNDYNQVIGDRSRDLVWLRWFNPGQRNLHSLSSLKNLRVLEFFEEWNHEKHLEELWETNSDGPVQLRELVIYGCSNFQGFPKSIGCLQYLKKIVLRSSGEKMKSLPESFCLLQSLEHLESDKWSELSSLPNNFGNLKNLRHLVLSGCDKLSVLPDSFKKLTLLQHLCLEGCHELILESDLFENMTKVEYLDLQGCRQLTELPLHITNQASLRELDLRDIRIREIPMNINQLSKLQEFYVGSDELTSLPTTFGDLFSLTYLSIDSCSKLECLPDSVGHLNLLDTLKITGSGLKSLPKSLSQLNNLQTVSIINCPISDLDLNSLQRELDLNTEFPLSFCNLKDIQLAGTKVSKISISEDCCPGLESLRLQHNEHLKEIEVLPTTRVRNISGIAQNSTFSGLVNIRNLWIYKSPMLDALPNFAQLPSLQNFELKDCHGVTKIQGLEQCRALERLRVETMWEEAGIESLEGVERLRSLHLTAISRSAIEGCIQSMQKWPAELMVCTHAVPESGSLVDSFAFTNVSVIDSFSNLPLSSCPSLKLSSNAHAIMLCFIINCNQPQMDIMIHPDDDTRDIDSLSLNVVKGKWVLIYVSTRSYKFHMANKLQIRSIYSQDREEEVERGMVVVGEEERVVHAFHSLWKLISN